MASIPYVPPPGQSGGGDAGARAAGFSDYSAYQLAVAQQQSASQPVNAMQLAQQAQQMQIAANQPAIQTLQTQETSLSTQYQSLLDSITASEQPALNSVTQATNAEMAKRGITGDSTLEQQNLAAAQAPVATQFGQLTASTGVAETQDLSTLAGQIASLQAGNVPGALSFASGIAGQEAQLQAAQIAANIPQVVSSGGILVDPTTGKTVASNNTINGLGNTSSSNTSTTPSITTLNNNPTSNITDAQLDAAAKSLGGTTTYLNGQPTINGGLLNLSGVNLTGLNLSNLNSSGLLNNTSNTSNTSLTLQ